MKRLSNLFGACFSAAILAACGGGSSTPLSPSPAGVAAQRTHVRPAYAVLYSFKGGSGDGGGPYAGLINVKGTLYGTTEAGGANDGGTVFSITPSGTETVLYSFKGGSGDGAQPLAGLLNVKGTLYGTTNRGGANDDGTVFAITTSGVETVLHSFAGSGDGALPLAGLFNVKGTLYGTTGEGGANGDGTVFSITRSGTETVLYSFKGGLGDGELPAAGLINLNGTLYSTTLYAGANNDGTVFAITTSGTETVLHSFAGGKHGKYPDAGLINVNGTLYGTTFNEGVGALGRGGTHRYGTVFSITRSGAETVLYSFKGGLGDGELPAAGLINVNGTLYGTTVAGGGSGCYNGTGCGTVFSITRSGTESVLHSFGSSGDGSDPRAGLINVNGTLYGTTVDGGANGDGTVFSLSP